MPSHELRPQASTAIRLDIGDLSPDDHPAVVALAGDPRWAGLRYLARFGHDIAGAEQADRVGRTIAGPGIHLAARRGGELVGQATARPIDDLADHFGVPVHEIGPILTTTHPTVDRHAVARSLLAELVASLRGAEPGLVFIRLEADDVEAVTGAEAAGFHLRETTLTFINDLERADRNPRRQPVGTRVHRFAEDGPLPEHTAALLATGGAQVSADHYHADPRLPAEACDALYERLGRRILRGEGADVMVLRSNDDQLVGFGSWRAWSELDPYGVAMVGSSFGFRLPDAPAGNLVEVGIHVCNESLLGNRLLEWSTQATNFSMVNMLCRQPSIRLCRTSQVLHAWTDG